MVQTDVSGFHGKEQKVTAVVVHLVDHQFGKPAELHFEGVATTVQDKGSLLQLVLGENARVQLRVLNESLRTRVVDKHADTSNRSILAADLSHQNGEMEKQRKSGGEEEWNYQDRLLTLAIHSEGKYDLPA
mgnify:CR=1 FL=1